MTAPIPFERPVFVTRPVLPPLGDYVALLETVWQSHALTNMGPMHQMLERAIGDRLGVGQVALWNNGTSALMGAIRALDLRGKVVVTPFTFPATVHAIALLGLEPIFADIDEESLTIDPAKITEVLVDEVSGIMGTHVYGRLCDTAGIFEVAQASGLKVVYDGAHSFSRNPPIFPDDPTVLGDITTLSFHATKLFHSVEGGATITSDPELDRRLRLLRNFGIASESDVELIGMNGKLSEVHAAMGIAMLGMIEGEIAQREGVASAYIAGLEGVDGIRIVAGNAQSMQYFVVRVDPDAFGSDRDSLFDTLRSMNVVARKYFSPLCSDMEPYSALPSAQNLPIARAVASQVLALPFYGGMSTDDATRITDIVKWHHDGNRR